MIIQDGTGSKTSAKVNSDNSLKTTAIVEPRDHYIAQKTGRVWSVPFEAVDPTGADDYFLYIKNNNNDYNLNITDIRISSTVVGLAEVHAVSGDASGGTSITAVSRLVGSTLSPTATLEYGVDITGLSNDGILFFIDIDATGKLIHLRTTSNIILPPGNAIALLWSAGTGALTGTVSIVEEEIASLS